MVCFGLAEEGFSRIAGLSILILVPGVSRRGVLFLPPLVFLVLFVLLVFAVVLFLVILLLLLFLVLLNFAGRDPTQGIAGGATTPTSSSHHQLKSQTRAATNNGQGFFSTIFRQFQANTCRNSELEENFG